MLSQGFRLIRAFDDTLLNSHRPTAAPRGLAGPESHYRPDVDGLRAIAVLSVLGFHALPEYVHGGFVGVDVFFVISGYLISRIILATLLRSDFSLREFYARRARRILPALTLVLTACLLFGALVLLPDELASLGKDAAAAAAFVANLAFWNESGYFAPASQSEPLLHLWSLGIEEQFYLLWPVVLLVAWRRGWNVTRLIVLITLVSFGLNLALADTNESGNFYFPLSRFWELGLGCILAALESARQRAQRGQTPLEPGPLRRMVRGGAQHLTVAGMALILTAVCAFDRHTPFPGIAALLPTVGTACILAAPPGSWPNKAVLGNRLLVFIGLISYPLYLWHWPILAFMSILQSGKPPLLLRVAAVCVSFVLATLTFRLIEIPVRRSRRLRVSVGFATVTAILGVIGMVIVTSEGLPSRFGRDLTAGASGPRADSLCRRSAPELGDINYCRRTNPKPPEVVFLGDSQAQSVYEGAVSTLGTGKPMVLLGRGGCPPALNVPTSPKVYVSDQRRKVCNETWARLVSYVRSSPPELVVLVGDDSRFFAYSDPGSPGTVEEQDEHAFKAGLNELVSALQPYSNVVYLLEIPTFPTDPACFLRPIRLPGGNCSPSIPRRALTKARSEYKDSVLELQRAHPGMVVIDPVPALCDVRSCSQISRAGEVLYHDQMHLNRIGGQRLARASGLAGVIRAETGGDE